MGREGKGRATATKSTMDIGNFNSVCRGETILR
jgi:hypothetical protein